MREKWIEVEDISIFKSRGFETGFDGCIQFFKLSSDKPEIDRLISDGFFYDFAHWENGYIFLRHIKDRHSWPKTTLLALDLKRFTLTEVFESNGAMIQWNVDYLSERTFRILHEVEGFGHSRVLVLREAKYRGHKVVVNETLHVTEELLVKNRLAY